MRAGNVVLTFIAYYAANVHLKAVNVEGATGICTDRWKLLMAKCANPVFCMMHVFMPNMDLNIKLVLSLCITAVCSEMVIQYWCSVACSIDDHFGPDTVSGPCCMRVPPQINETNMQ